MTDIILINFRNERDMYPPFGIMYVADALIQQGHSVAVWHETEEALDEFVAAVERERPLWVGFSTITGPQLKTTIDATKRVHALGIPTVWGGVHATIMPEEVLKEDYVDFVVVNEGELTAQEFTHELQNGRNWAEVRGLAWKDPKITSQWSTRSGRSSRTWTTSSPAGTSCPTSTPTCCNPARTTGQFPSTSAAAAHSAAPFATTRSS